MLYQNAISTTTFLESFVEAEVAPAPQTRLVGLLTEYFDRPSNEEAATSKIKAKWGFRDTLLIENQKIW